MIQRIQTVFLALAICLLIASLFVPVWSVSNKIGNETAVLYGMKIDVNNTDARIATQSIPFTDNLLVMFYFALAISVSGFLAYVIFAFNDRIKQMKMAYAGAAAVMVLLVLMVVSTTKLGDNIAGIAGEGTFDFGFFFPLAAVLLVWFAAKRIKSDEDLVKSVDRFR